MTELFTPKIDPVSIFGSFFPEIDSESIVG